MENDIADFNAIIGDEPTYEIGHFIAKPNARETLEGRGSEVLAPSGEVSGRYEVSAKKDDFKTNVEYGIARIFHTWESLIMYFIFPL